MDRKQPSRWQRQLGFVACLAMGGMLSTPFSGTAQNITLDGTLAPAGTLIGPIYVIPQSVGTTVNTNLFHSFGRFNLNTNEAAIFQSAANIQNILARVTGGSRSEIDGLIATQSRNVNLFLINPSGILFGANAQLNVGGSTRGSVVATTVDAVTWANGGQFSATTPRGSQSLLSIVGDPSGFLTSQRTPAQIQSIGSQLGVFPGQSLLLLGGNVALNNSSLFVGFGEGGRIELGGVSRAGTVGLTVSGNQFSLQFPNGSDRADISITNGSNIDVTALNGGSIAIYARNLDISETSSLSGGVLEGFGPPGSRAGDITLNATGTISLKQASSVVNGGSFFGFSKIGNGNIAIETGSLSVTEGSSIGSLVLGRGDAGNVTINARDTVVFDGESRAGSPSIAISSVAFAEGKGGDIGITTGSLFVTNGAGLFSGTLGIGDAGTIAINARDRVVFDGVSNSSGNPSQASSSVIGMGQGGGINITTGSLFVTNGATLNSST